MKKTDISCDARTVNGVRCKYRAKLFFKCDLEKDISVIAYCPFHARFLKPMRTASRISKEEYVTLPVMES